MTDIKIKKKRGPKPSGNDVWFSFRINSGTKLLIEALALRDNENTSEWIRLVVEREIASRTKPKSET